MRWTDHDPRSHRPTLYTRITFSYLSFPLLRSLAPLSNELCFAPSSRKFGYEITGAGRLSSSAPSDIMRESARARCPKTKEGRGTSETRPARVSSRSISSLLETNQSFSQGNEIYCEYIYIYTHTQCYARARGRGSKHPLYDKKPDVRIRIANRVFG